MSLSALLWPDASALDQLLNDLVGLAMPSPASLECVDIDMDFPSCTPPPAVHFSTTRRPSMPVFGVATPAPPLPTPTPPLPTLDLSTYVAPQLPTPTPPLPTLDLSAYVALATCLPALDWPANLTDPLPGLGAFGSGPISGPTLADGGAAPPLPAVSQPCADLADLDGPDFAADLNIGRRQSMPMIDLGLATLPSPPTGPAIPPPMAPVTPPLVGVSYETQAAAEYLVRSWQPTLSDLYSSSVCSWPAPAQPAGAYPPPITGKRRRETRSKPAKRAAPSDSASCDTDADSGTRAKKAKFTCDQCGKRFTRPSSLATHGFTHSGEKPHACPFPGCGKCFSVLSNLRRHWKTHQNSPQPRSKAQQPTYVPFPADPLPAPGHPMVSVSAPVPSLPCVPSQRPPSVIWHSMVPVPSPPCVPSQHPPPAPWYAAPLFTIPPPAAARRRRPPSL